MTVTDSDSLPISLPSLPPLDYMRASLARDSLFYFIRQAWHLVEPGIGLKWNWHHDELCNVLEQVSREELKRVIINIPPGFSKSLIVSVLWPAWEWASNPSLRYLTASYTDDNTIRDNRRLRFIVKSDWYRSSFGVELSSDQSAKIRFDTTAKGFRIATSVGGVATGEHPDRIIIDDPIKALDAESPAERQKCIDWYKSTVSTRIARNPAVVVIMQRLHLNDLTGYLLSTESGFEHVCFPMHFNSDHKVINGSDPRDHRSIPGELLWPEEWSEEKVKQEELDLGEYGRAGQLEQDPIPEGGAMFKREWFDIVDSLPDDYEGVFTSCRGWDTAATDEKDNKKSDRTAGVKIVEHRNSSRGILTYYISHALAIRTEDADRVIVSTAKLDSRSTLIGEEQEPGGSGKSVIKYHRKQLSGYDYAEMPTGQNKSARARPFRTQAEGGNVKLLRGSWNSEYLDELCSFPFGSHDDYVDATSCAFNRLTDPDKKKKKRAGTFGRGRR